MKNKCLFLQMAVIINELFCDGLFFMTKIMMAIGVNPQFNSSWFIHFTYVIYYVSCGAAFSR